MTDAWTSMSRDVLAQFLWLRQTRSVRLMVWLLVNIEL